MAEKATFVISTEDFIDGSDSALKLGSDSALDMEHVFQLLDICVSMDQNGIHSSVCRWAL